MKISALMQGTQKLVLAALVLLPAPLLMGASRPTVARHHATTSGPNSSGMMATSVPLFHLPSGTASLSWQAATQMLTVTLNLTGLAPNSIHPAHIHSGMCNQDAPIKYTLRSVYADSTGNGSSTTVIRNVSNGIPPGGWSINVHNGPGLTKSSTAASNQYTALACGNIFNQQGYGGFDQTMGMQLYPTMDVNQMAFGYANLYIRNNTLYVEVYVRNLEPYSLHAAHIHLGSCEKQGKVAYMLHDVQADGSGSGASFTSISGISSIPTSGWYINTHMGDSMHIGTQTGFDPIACGDIR